MADNPEMTVEEVLDANLQLFDTTRKTHDDMSSILDGHHRFFLDLTNYYFAFQGVLLAAVSGSSYYNCVTGWFLTVLALLCAFPSITTMCFLAHGWLAMTAEIDQVLRGVYYMQGPLDAEQARRLEVMKNRFSVTTGRKFSPGIRYALVIFGGTITAIFTVCVAILPYRFICDIHVNNIIPSP